MNDPNPNRAIIDALRDTLERDPRNSTLWVHLADLLAGSGLRGEAVQAYKTALELDVDPVEVAGKLIPLLRAEGQLAEALIRAEKILEKVEDVPIRVELARVLLARGDATAGNDHYQKAVELDPSVRDPELEERLAGGRAGEDSSSEIDGGIKTAVPSSEEAQDREPVAAEVNPEPTDPEDWASQFDWGDLHVTLDDVAGLDDVKKQVHLRIIAPYKNRAVFEAFGRKGGGGILLYGPPGCGKTYIARATAGECGARFVSVAIHDIVDKYWGESEKMIHALFEEARRKTPTVLFFDEFDALGSARGRTESQFWKTMVDQLLQEMDGISGSNDEILIFGATNVPWNVDSAFRRPGRFDRVLFVPPPDQKARTQILTQHLKPIPGGESLSAAKLAKKTELYTGADLKALCERAAERALTLSLDTGEIHPLTLEDVLATIEETESTAREWLSTARNYARYANQGGQYDALANYLKKAKKF